MLIRLWIILAVFYLAAPGLEAANGDLAAVSDTLSSSNRELIDMASVPQLQPLPFTDTVIERVKLASEKAENEARVMQLQYDDEAQRMKKEMEDMRRALMAGGGANVKKTTEE